MPPAATSSNTTPDRRKNTSRKIAAAPRRPERAADSLAVWAERYLALAVRGARSAEVTGTITRYLDSFHAARQLGTLARTPLSVGPRCRCSPR